jgi:DNA-binding transcriptional MerR regulator
MNRSLLTLKDLSQKTGLPELTVAGWIKDKLLRPAGFADDQTPLFPAAAADRAVQIRKLGDLGYGPEEIQKIIKKVGLPQDRDGRKAARDEDRFLTVGNLAEQSGVSPRTIKHWEDKGIIEPDMRTEGGFRLYSESYVFICKLICDLQLFGYTLEEIKAVSDDVRALLAIEDDLEALPTAEVGARLESMLKAIQALVDKMDMLESGIERWEDLLKKKKKDIRGLKARNEKRGKPAKGDNHA